MIERSRLTKLMLSQSPADPCKKNSENKSTITQYSIQNCRDISQLKPVGDERVGFSSYQL